MSPARQIAFSMIATAIAAAGLSLAAQPLAPPESTPAVPPGAGGEEICEDCVVVDDGTAETGYGWVPSVIEGEYVQRIHTGQFPTRNLESACVCWIRTQPDSTIDFEVVFYDDIDGVPAPSPYAAVPASAVVEPVGITETFTEVDVSAVTLPVGPSYIGVRWDPSVDQFFFVCTDTSAATAPVNVFFRDDRTPGLVWTSVFASIDPIFDDHRSIMLRACSDLETPIEVPTLGVGALAALMLLLASAGVRTLSGRRRAEP